MPGNYYPGMYAQPSSNPQSSPRSLRKLSPTMRNLPPWDNRAHVTFSKNNAAYHTQYREFFDKSCGNHQYTDQFKYIYKTPSNGQRDYEFFQTRSKYYWDKRSPVSPRSKKKDVQDFVEDGFTKDFEVMYSKNNHHRHPLKREYFDMPVNYIHKGFLFSPKTKIPIDLYENGQSHYNVRVKGLPYNSSRSVLGTKNDGSETLTTGMPDLALFNTSFPKPKNLSKLGGKPSDDFGSIPQLRSPYKPKKHRRGMRNFARTIMDSNSTLR